ncbi:MAG: molybdopterin-guanine dinucleotide biosynthesis protein MobB [Thermovirgaceae bacterium]|nr:molybdopterin-guanine dinucleotide biosynthesis protein MobB [Thermovirgaceae bacterium]
MPFILAVSGFKNSGKTTLCSKLISLLLEDGVEAVYVKHTHENVLSPNGSDSGLLAGVIPRVALWGPDGVRIEEADEKIDTASLAARFFPGKHLLLLEGGKSFSVPKIWVGSPLEIPEEVSGVVAFYDRDNPCAKERHFAAGEEADLAALVASMARGAEASPAEIYCGDKRIPAKAFVGEFISGAVKGMLKSLKGDFDLSAGVGVYLRRRNREK